MKPLVRLTLLASLAGFLLSFTACSGKKDGTSSVDPKDLQYLAMAVIMYSDQHGKGAANVDDLKTVFDAKNADAVLAQVKAGDIVVPWNVNVQALARTPDGIGKYVI